MGDSLKERDCLLAVAAVLVHVDEDQVARVAPCDAAVGVDACDFARLVRDEEGGERRGQTVLVLLAREDLQHLFVVLVVDTFAAVDERKERADVLDAGEVRPALVGEHHLVLQARVCVAFLADVAVDVLNAEAGDKDVRRSIVAVRDHAL